MLGNNAVAIDFLKKVYPDEPWLLTAIHPDRKAMETRTFRPETEEALLAWLHKHNGNSNIYWSTNPPLRDLTKKATREDIKEVAFLHVDVDPRAGEDLEAERARCAALFNDKLPEGIPSPTVIIFSGGGYQAFWKLETPIPIFGDLAKAEDAKRYNQALELAFGGDNCHNIDRIMRLPGTVNLPDATKLKKGRTPQLATLVAFEGNHVYPLTVFKQAPLPAEAPPAAGPLAPAPIGDAIRTGDPEELNQWNVPDRVKVIMVQGLHPDEPKEGDNSRSMWVFDFACNMMRAGVPDERTLGILLDPGYGISESVREKGNPHRYAVRQIERAREHVRLDVEFDTDNGKTKLTPKNFLVAMQKLGVSVRHDTFSNRLLIDGLPGYELIDDASLTRLRLAIDERFHFLPPKELFFDVAADAARAAPFHPVREYLDNLKWDGEPRIDRWLKTYANAEDTPYTRAVGELVLIAAVRRIRKPGCKFDEMLVLECSQGTDKSSALAILAVNADWFTDDMPLNADTAKVLERLNGKWIVEAAELNGMRNGQTDHLKAFLSRQVDIARPAYGRFAVEVPRQSVFIGTTNNDNYLRDETGNRRFWPVKIGTFDLETLRRDRDQLWAEAAAREAEGRSIRLDPALYAVAAVEQEARRVDDPFVTAFREALGDLEGKLKAADAWTVLDIPTGQRTQAHNTRLGAALRELGWKKTKVWIGSKSEWGYVKGRAKHLKRVMVERSSTGYVRVFYEGVQHEPDPF
jgi:hypothetical protein